MRKYSQKLYTATVSAVTMKMHLIIFGLILVGFMPIIEKLKASLSPVRALFFQSCMGAALALFIITNSDPSIYWFGFAAIIAYGLFKPIRRYRQESAIGPHERPTEVV